MLGIATLRFDDKLKFVLATPRTPPLHRIYVPLNIIKADRAVLIRHLKIISSLSNFSRIDGNAVNIGTESAVFCGEINARDHRLCSDSTSRDMCLITCAYVYLHVCINIIITA